MDFVLAKQSSSSLHLLPSTSPSTSIFFKSPSTVKSSSVHLVQSSAMASIEPKLPISQETSTKNTSIRRDITQFKAQLARLKGQVEKCKKVPTDVQHQIKKSIEEMENKKRKVEDEYVESIPCDKLLEKEFYRLIGPHNLGPYKRERRAFQEQKALGIILELEKSTDLCCCLVWMRKDPKVGDLSNVVLNHLHGVDLPNVVLSHLRGVDLPNVVLNHLHGVDLPNVVLDHLRGVDLPNVVLSHLLGVDLPNVVLNHLHGVDLPNVVLGHLCGVDLPNMVLSHLLGVDLPNVVLNHLRGVDLPNVVLSHLLGVDLPNVVLNHLHGVDLPNMVLNHLHGVDLPNMVLNHLRGVDLPNVVLKSPSWCSLARGGIE
ncbi:hypothetical protein Lal_00027146 [Lupinus albus]|nr:hypothetical protein Lal_00027146 [Lupinus albus]